MTILETVTGNATFSQRMAKVQVFFVPTRDQGGKELPLGITVQQNPSAGVRVAQKLGTIPAGQGMDPAKVGEFRQVNYDLPDGTLVKIFCDRTIPGSRFIGNQYIRIRANAAFQEIKAQLTNYPKASINEAVIRGCFDVLSPDEARSLGARIPNGYEKFYTRQAVNGVFHYAKLQDEKQPRVVVQTKEIENSEGGKVVIQVPKSRRKLVVD